MYTVTVTDNAGLTAYAQVLVNQPPSFGVSAFGQNQICSVSPDGSAVAVPFGGAPPYQFLWNTGAAIAQITGLAQGSYTVTATDTHGCTASSSVSILYWNEGLWITADAKQGAGYVGQQNGKASVMAMSGTAPYTYHWSNGVTITSGGMTHSIENLGAGNYTVTVTDVNGCSHDASVVIQASPGQFSR